MDRHVQTRIVNLEARHRDRLIALLSSAFSQYPLFEILLDHSQDASENQIEDIIRFWVDIYFTHEYQLKGCFVDERLVAGAMITAPNAVVDTARIEVLSKRLIDQIGRDNFVRLDDYENAAESGLPLTTHHFLGILAVDPEYQRRGFGRQLVDHIARDVARSGASSGVCLTTEAHENVGYYQSLGFTTITEVSIHGITSWGMKLDT